MACVSVLGGVPASYGELVPFPSCLFLSAGADALVFLVGSFS